MNPAPPQPTLFPYTTLFRSRVGMAYRFAPKMVMRGGYGISYSFFNRMGSAQEAINSPQAVFGVITQSIPVGGDRKSTRLNSSHPSISYAVFCLKKKRQKPTS